MSSNDSRHKSSDYLFDKEHCIVYARETLEAHIAEYVSMLSQSCNTENQAGGRDTQCT